MTRSELIQVQGEMVSLREYIESKLESLNEATRVRAESLEKRFEAVNEFRATLSDQASRFVTRDIVDAMLDRIHEEIAGLKKFQYILEGKANQSAVTIAMLLSLAGLVLGVASFLLGVAGVLIGLFL